MLEHKTYYDQAYLDRRHKYFLALPSSQSIPALYGCLESNDLLFQFVRDTILQGELFDFNALFTLLASKEFNVQKWGLSLAKANKPYYTAEDVTLFSKLIDVIKFTFGIRAQFIEEKSKITSSVKQKWICECGVKNNKDDQRCTSCSKDIYGFYDNETKPDQIVKLLQYKVNILKEVFQ